MKIRKPEHLEKLDKNGLIEFLKSDMEDKIEIWNDWQENYVYNIGHQKIDLRAADLSGLNLSNIIRNYSGQHRLTRNGI